MSERFSLEVNGEIREYAGDGPPRTVAQLIESLGLDAKMVVAEINGDIVRRQDLPTRELRNGDKIELVRFVGGG